MTCVVFFFKQKTAYEMRTSDWSSDVCSSDLIFSGRFTPLMGFGGRVDDLYADILLRVFNASARQRLKLVNIKSSKGELALRVGDAEPFGLINIGDDAGFFGLAEDAEAFDHYRADFGGAMSGHRTEEQQG